MPTFQDLLENVEDSFTTSLARLNQANVYANYLESSFGAYMDAAAEGYWTTYHERIYDAIRYAIHKNYNPEYDALTQWMEKAMDEGLGGDVTMDSILSAMISADYQQLQKFVGLVDAYRMAIWNQPFNAEFYAALARGFME